MSKTNINNCNHTHATDRNLNCQRPNSTRLWLQSRLDGLSTQFYDALDGLEGMITYDYSKPYALYAEYHLSASSPGQIECFQKEVGYYLHRLIDSYRDIERPPSILYVKHHRISINPPQAKALRDC